MKASKDGRWLPRGVAAIAAILSAAAQAQQATIADSNSPQLDTVTITGTLLKRTDLETPSPVQVISSQDLKDSGYTNLSDVLRNLSANGQGALGQSFGQAFASGGSGIALRGLTVGGTLTLIDGSHLPNRRTYSPSSPRAWPTTGYWHSQARCS